MLKGATKIRQLRKEAGLSQEALAERAGIGTAGQVSRYETGATPPFNDGWIKIANAFNVRPEDLLGPETGEHRIRLVGNVGAGAEVFPLDDEVEWVPAPAGIVGMVAVRVVGTSMLPVYRQGDLLFAEAREFVAMDVIGKDCIVKVQDGPRLVKRVLRGGKPDWFRLFSYDTQDVSDDLMLEWAAPVRWVSR